MATGEEPEVRIKLPFRAGNSHKCIQGNGGDQSHHENGVNEFAVDFRMSPGTRVCAAAAGRVIALVQDTPPDAPWSDFGEFRNYIWIDHGVGLYTVYGNIRNDSATVRVGQLVNAGQVIALSGEAEMHQDPHLHFAVTDSGRRSVPLSFLDSGIPKKDKGVPMAGQTCGSDNDGTGTQWFTEDSMLRADTFGEKITITSPIPASALRWNQEYTVEGTVQDDDARKVCIFFTRPPGTHAIAHRMVPIQSGRRFTLTFKLADFAATLLQEQGYRFAIAPVAKDQSFASDVTVDFAILDREPFTSLAMNLPFRSGQTCKFRRVATPAGEGTASVLLFDMPKETHVLASAQGRVVAIGADMELPFDALGRSRKTSYVTLDHGYGMHTTYFGLLAKSIKVKLGDVVNAGDRLAASHKSDLARELHLGFALSDHAFVTQPASFVEWETDPGDAGDARSANDGGGSHLFLEESRLPPDDFAANALTLANEPPASIYHVATDYVVEGTSTAEEVAFLVRQRGKDRNVVAAKAAVEENGRFRMTVRLDDVKLPKGDALDYAITALKSPRDFKAETWRRLVAKR